MDRGPDEHLDSNRVPILRIYVYDAYPGGVGLSEPLFEKRGRTLERAATLVRSCPCESGCPACVAPAGEHRKKIALEILGRLRAS